MGVGKMGQIIGETGVGEMGVGKMGVIRQNISCLFVNLDKRSHYVKRPQFSISTNTIIDQDQDQDSLLVKRRNDNHSPGPVIRELVPSSHQRSELSNTILCIFSG